MFVEKMGSIHIFELKNVEVIHFPSIGNFNILLCKILIFVSSSNFHKIQISFFQFQLLIPNYSLLYYYVPHVWKNFCEMESKLKNYNFVTLLLHNAMEITNYILKNSNKVSIDVKFTGNTSDGATKDHHQ